MCPPTLGWRSVTDARRSVGLRRWCRPASRLACARGRRGSNRRGRVRGDRCGKQRWLPASARARRRARAWASRLRCRGDRLVRRRSHALPHRSWRAGARGRPVAAGAPLGGKTDALDAVRAARSVLADKRAATPRAGGERQALQALVAAREGAVNAKRAGLCQLRDLLITTPEPLRAELRPLTRARLLQRLAATRPEGRHDPELRGSLLALALHRATRAAADRRGARARPRDRDADAQARAAAARAARRRSARRRTAPALLVTPRTDQLAKRRSRGSPAQPRSPPPPAKPSATASTAAGDRKLNRALHMILVTRNRSHPADDLLHRTSPRRRQDTPRNKPMPQALPRPQPLPTPRTRAPLTA